MSVRLPLGREEWHHHRVLVVGLGIDVVSVSRVERVLARFGDRFWERILTPAERGDLHARVDRAVALAGRFAAKEAATKALGGPLDVLWHDLEIRTSSKGPMLSFAGSAVLHAERLSVVRSLVSITHDAGIAAAVVVLEGGAG